MTAELSGNEENRIKTAVRIRPLSKSEEENQEKIIATADFQTGEIILLNPIFFESSKQTEKLRKLEERKYLCDIPLWSVDRNHPDYSNQADVFEAIGKPLINDALEGLNCSLFAYGQTGSGKTFTMMGNPSTEEQGIIPRFCSELFSQLNHAKTSSQQMIQSTDIESDVTTTCVMESNVEVSYYEIYNEKIFDLLSTTPETACKVREHPTEGAFVDGLTLRHVKSYEEIAIILEEGHGKRQVAETLMNATSSRSHAVFTLHLTQKILIPKPKHLQGKINNVSDFMQRKSKVNLIDLAGSERLNSTGATGDRLKEATNINRSLFVLGEVIKTLSENADKGTEGFVPYRNSLLTWILKDSLGGNSKTTMLATISPIGPSHSETTNTLRYIERAKLVSSKARVNDDNANDPYIKHLQQQVALYKGKLNTALTQLREKDAEYEKKVAELNEELETLKVNLKDSHRLSRRLSRAISNEINDVNNSNSVSGKNESSPHLSPISPSHSLTKPSPSSTGHLTIKLEDEDDNGNNNNNSNNNNSLTHLQIDLLATSSTSSINGDDYDPGHGNDKDNENENDMTAANALAIQLDDVDDSFSSKKTFSRKKPTIRTLATEVRQLQEALSLSMLECEEARQRLIESEDASRLEIEYLQERLQAGEAEIGSLKASSLESLSLERQNTIDRATIRQLEDNIAGLDSIIETLQLRLVQKDGEIQEVKENGKRLLADHKLSSEMMINELEKKNSTQAHVVEEQKEQIASLQSKLQMFDESFTLQGQEHNAITSRYEQAILDLKEILEQNDHQLRQQISSLQESLFSSTNELMSVRNDLLKKESEIEEHDLKHSHELQDLCDEIERMNLLINQRIQHYEGVIQTRKDEIKQLQLTLSTAEGRIVDYEIKIQELNTLLGVKDQSIEQLQGRINEISEEIVSKDQVIAELKNQIETILARKNELELALTQKSLEKESNRTSKPSLIAKLTIEKPTESPSSSSSSSSSVPLNSTSATSPPQDSSRESVGKKTVRRSLSYMSVEKSTIQQLKLKLLEKEKELQNTKLEHEQDILEFCDEVLKLKSLVDTKVNEFSSMNTRHEEIRLSSKIEIESLKKELNDVQSLHEFRLLEVLSDLETLQEDIRVKVSSSSSLSSEGKIQSEAEEKPNSLQSQSSPTLRSPLPPLAQPAPTSHSLSSSSSSSRDRRESLHSSSSAASSPRNSLEGNDLNGLSSPNSCGTGGGGGSGGSGGGGSSTKLETEVMKELKQLRVHFEEQEKNHEMIRKDLQTQVDLSQERIKEFEKEQIEQRNEMRRLTEQYENRLIEMEKERNSLRAQLESRSQLNDDPRGRNGNDGKKRGFLFCGG